MGSVALIHPIYSDDGVTYTPEITGGSWNATLTLANLQDQRLSKVARSSDTELASTRMHIDLETSRVVGGVVLPKHTLSTAAKVRVLAPSDSCLFSYEAGDDVTVKSGTFTNTSASRAYVDRNGVVRTAATTVIRDAHFESSVRTSLLELSRTNICLQSQTFGTTWIGVRSSISSDTAVAPDGTTTADSLVEDATAANSHRTYMPTLTITSNGTVAASVYVKSAGRTWVRLHVIDQATATTDGFEAYFNLSTGATGATVNTGAGVLATKRIESVGNSWYRCTITGAVNNAVTSVRFDIAAAEGDSDITFNGTSTTALYLWGAQLENSSTFATSYIPTTTVAVTRNADELLFSLPTGLTTPVASTYYLKFVERGTVQIASGRLLQISESGSNVSSLRVIGTGTVYQAIVSDSGGSATSTSTAAATPAFGDTVELRITLSSTGVVTLGQSINGAAEVVAASGAAGGLPTVWGTGTAKMRLNFLTTGGGSSGAVALKSYRVIAGSSNTLATMQAALHDSGWMDGWPSGLSLENADGINVPFVYLPASDVTARYWSVQIDDYSNTDTYIDLARLVIGKKYEPTINMNLGPRLGLIDDTVKTKSDGGATIKNVRAKQRTLRFVLDHMTEAEAFSDPWLVMRLAGTSGQLYIVYDVDDTDEMLAERSFLGTLEELGALEEPHADGRHTIAFAVTEEL